MRQVVCDTNVIISGIIFGGNARSILRLIAGGGISACISAALITELRDVLSRPKFKMSPHAVAAQIELVLETFHMVSPQIQIAAVAADPDDNAVLEAAVAACADTVISGDHHLLELRNFRNVLIMTPREFLDTWSVSRVD